MESANAQPVGGKNLDGSTVSSADFARRFGQLRQMGDHQAIFVTHHGRPTHVLTTIRHYTELQDATGSSQVDVGLTPSLHDLADCLTVGVLVIDYDLRILAANPVAHAQFDRTEGELAGHRIFSALPLLHGSLIETYIQRSVASKEPSSAEIPSLLRAGTWVRVDIHPFARYMTVLFHDITEDTSPTYSVHRRHPVTDRLRHPSAQMGVSRLFPRGESPGPRRGDGRQ